MMKKLLRIIRTYGLSKTFWCAWKYLVHGRAFFAMGLESQIVTSAQYQKWCQKYESYNKLEIQNSIHSFEIKPLVSIIVPVYNVRPDYLDACIQSVIDQYYDDWELCLYDDASTNEGTLNCLKHWEGRDPRIKVKYGEINGHISHATNQAVTLATGSWYAFLDNDDTLAPWALYEVIQSLQSKPEAKYAYTDEDKIDTQGRRYAPFFKPDFSIDYFMSCNYICHFRWCRADIYHQAGGERQTYEGSQDYDLALRVASIISPTEFLHVDAICYHWRVIEGSAASGPSSKHYAFENARRAIQEYYDRKQESAVVNFTEHFGVYRTSRALATRPRVSIIIPTHQSTASLRNCLENLIVKTTYSNYEILLLLDGATSREAHLMLQKYSQQSDIKLLNCDAYGSYSARTNHAVEESSGQYVLLLNGTANVVTPNWIEELLQHAQRPDVGAVGCKISYENGKIQHAGVTLGSDTLLKFPYFEADSNEPGYGGSIASCRNYSIVSRDCLMVRKTTYQKVQMDKSLFPEYHSVMDLCLEFTRQGLVNVYNPYAEIILNSLPESFDVFPTYSHDTRGQWLKKQQENVAFLAKWESVVAHDPMYNNHIRNILKQYPYAH